MVDRQDHAVMNISGTNMQLLSLKCQPKEDVALGDVELSKKTSSSSS